MFNVITSPVGQLSQRFSAFGVAGVTFLLLAGQSALANPPVLDNPALIRSTGVNDAVPTLTLISPVAGIELRIVDDEGRTLPWDGESIGEIEVRGPWVTGSYYGVDDAEKFHDGWLRTGDVGFVDERGYSQITDRAKDVIKSGGEWISSVELENTIIAHPEVAEAAVVGIPDDKWDERPLACIVRKEGSTITPEDLRTYLEGKVAKWWLPERWTFIQEIPKTSVGKFDKKVLRAQHAAKQLTVIHT